MDLGQSVQYGIRNHRQVYERLASTTIPYLLLIVLMQIAQGSGVLQEYSPIYSDRPVPSPAKVLLVGLMELPAVFYKFSPHTLESYPSSFSSTSTRCNRDDCTRWRQRDCL